MIKKLKELNIGPTYSSKEKELTCLQCSITQDRFDVETGKNKFGNPFFVFMEEFGEEFRKYSKH